MQSIKELYVIGNGPSSSHTMGPAFAADFILNKYQNIKSVKIYLFGSLALTGKGHLTDYILDIKFKDIPHQIIFDFESKVKHPNTMKFIIDCDDKIFEETIVSIGGGVIETKDKSNKKVQTYSEHNFAQILDFCRVNSLSLVNYINKNEEKDLDEYLNKIYETMEEAKEKGIKTEGYLPGPLKVARKAHTMYENLLKSNDSKNIEQNVAIASFAVAEENASGGVIVIAPTCGSAGVIPGCITFLQLKGYSKTQIIDGLKVGGLIGMIAKTNASISGAECGCQAEIGVACAMGAAMIATVLGYSNEHVARAAEIAMEHSLGLTCDPVEGYVQIPCIERCAIFALKAINAANIAAIIPSGEAKVTFDQSLETMYQTGKDLNRGYRETAKKGLAKTLK